MEVQPGDTCTSIMQMVGLPLLLFYHLNTEYNPRDCNYLTPKGPYFSYGMCVYHQPGCSRGYAVAAGDTCDSIRADHSLSQAKLERLNPSLDCTNLITGRLMCVRARESDEQC